MLSESEPAKMLRIVSYISMTPKSLALPHVFKKRIEAYKKHWTTNHWPHQCRGLNRPKLNDPTIRGGLTENSLEDLDHVAQSLLGVEHAVGLAALIEE